MVPRTAQGRKAGGLGFTGSYGTTSCICDALDNPFCTSCTEAEYIVQIASQACNEFETPIKPLMAVVPVLHWAAEYQEDLVGKQRFEPDNTIYTAPKDLRLVL
jgi:hypothetical protein